MAFAFWRYIVFRDDEFEKLSYQNMIFTLYHEYKHTQQHKHFEHLSKGRVQREKEAQRYAVNKMLKQGLTFEDLIKFEAEYYILLKYGMSLKEYQDYMKLNNKKVKGVNNGKRF